MSTILELFGLRNVVPYRSSHGADAVNCAQPDQLVGLELEMENFLINDREFGGLIFTGDNSLRNNGVEAVTKPLMVKHLRGFLTAFYETFNVNIGNYSERCSTHVHFNVLPLTLDQITTICLVYQTVEELLFRVIGNDRENNIYCVPWNQCNLNAEIISKIEKGGPNANDVFRRWQKYAALNLIPITTQGTMEFRHLHGTCDVNLIMRWVNIVSMMFKYAQAVPLELAKDQILNMNTVSNYNHWLEDVFGIYAMHLRTPDFERLLSVGVVNSKLMLIPQKKLKWESIYNAAPAGWQAIYEPQAPEGLRVFDDIREDRPAEYNPIDARVQQRLAELRVQVVQPAQVNPAPRIRPIVRPR